MRIFDFGPPGFTSGINYHATSNFSYFDFDRLSICSKSRFWSSSNGLKVDQNRNSNNLKPCRSLVPEINSGGPKSKMQLRIGGILELKYPAESKQQFDYKRYLLEILSVMS